MASTRSESIGLFVQNSLSPAGPQPFWEILTEWRVLGKVLSKVLEKVCVFCGQMQIQCGRNLICILDVFSQVFILNSYQPVENLKE